MGWAPERPCPRHPTPVCIHSKKSGCSFLQVIAMSWPQAHAAYAQRWLPLLILPTTCTRACLGEPVGSAASRLMLVKSQQQTDRACTRAQGWQADATCVVALPPSRCTVPGERQLPNPAKQKPVPAAPPPEQRVAFYRRVCCARRAHHCQTAGGRAAQRRGADCGANVR